MRFNAAEGSARTTLFALTTVLASVVNLILVIPVHVFVSVSCRVTRKSSLPSRTTFTTS